MLIFIFPEASLFVLRNIRKLSTNLYDFRIKSFCLKTRQKKLFGGKQDGLIALLADTLYLLTSKNQ